MSATLRIAILVFALLFLVEVIRLVSKGRLQLKYSLLWLVVSIILIIAAVFPGTVSFFAQLFGFGLPSNMVLMIGIVLALGMCLSLTVIVSWQSRDIRSLVQRVSLMEKQLNGTDPYGEAEEERPAEAADSRQDPNPKGSD